MVFSYTEVHRRNVKVGGGHCSTFINLVLFLCDCLQNTDYVNWLMCDGNQSQEGRATELIYATIDFNKKRRSNMCDVFTFVLYFLSHLLHV